MSASITFETLAAMNHQLFGDRWSEEDLRELIAPRFGTISDLQGLNQALGAIREKNLGDTLPAFMAAEHP